MVTSNKLPGVAAYDNTQDLLFISNKLGSSKEMGREFSTGYFATKKCRYVMTYELAPKAYWYAAIVQI